MLLVTHQQYSLLNLALCLSYWGVTLTIYHGDATLMSLLSLCSYSPSYCCWKNIGWKKNCFQLVFLQILTSGLHRKNWRMETEQRSLNLVKHGSKSHLCQSGATKKIHPNTNSCKSTTQLFSNMINQIQCQYIYIWKNRLAEKTRKWCRITWVVFEPSSVYNEAILVCLGF